MVQTTDLFSMSACSTRPQSMQTSMGPIIWSVRSTHSLLTKETVLSAPTG